MMQLPLLAALPIDTQPLSSPTRDLKYVTITSTELDDVISRDADKPLHSVERSENTGRGHLSTIDADRRPLTPSICLTPPSVSEFTFASPFTPSRASSHAKSTPTLRGIDGPITALHSIDIETDGGNSTHNNKTPPSQRIDSQLSGSVISDDFLHDKIARMDLKSETDVGTTSPNANHLQPALASPAPSDASTASDCLSTPRRRSSSVVDHMPHRVEDEEPPSSLFHTPQLQTALAQTKSIVANILNIIEGFPLREEPDSMMRKLHIQAQDLIDFKSPADRIVGLVGDSGVGKSSLINSLLDCENFARTSNSGAACTCVVTEYHYHKLDHPVLEIIYFTRDEILQQFTELLTSYRLHNTVKHKSDDSSSKPTELKDLEERAKVARDTFRVAFRGTNGPTEQDLLVVPEVQARKLLQNAIDGICATIAIANGPKREMFASNDRCSVRLMELTSDVDVPNAITYWPVIQKIRVYMKAHILSKGLILADLPGLRDLNRARVKITERYLLICHQIFSICNIGRATTDQGVDEVFELAKKARLSNISIVCTRSDDIRADEAERDWKGENARIISNMKEDVKLIDQRLESINKAINELSFDSETESEDEEENARLSQLRRDRDNWRKKKDKAIFRMNEFVITIRNEKIIDELRRVRDRGLLSSGQIFCVSNRIYWDHRSKGRKYSRPFLNLSGISNLRRHCLSIVADSQLHAATQYMHDAVPALVGSLQIWVDSGAGTLDAETKQSIRTTIAKTKEQIISFSESSWVQGDSTRRLKQLFRQQISSLMEHQRSYFARSAEYASSQWSGWHHSSYAAFCRNYGDYQTPAVGRRCWNEEATASMRDVMERPWTQLSTLIEQHKEAFATLQDDAFKKAKTTVNPLASKTSSVQTLVKTLNHRQNLFSAAFQKVAEDFEGEMRHLKTDSLTGIRTSFTGRLLESTYFACNQDGGSGVDRRRKTAVRGRFGNEYLFHEIHALCRERFTAMVDKLETEIQHAVNEHLQVIMQDLDALMHENATTESESNPVLRRALGTELANTKLAMDSVQELIVAH